MTQQEIKKMASEIVGDGGEPNKWFVTVGPYVSYLLNPENNQYQEWASKMIPGCGEKDSTTYGPFNSLQEALDCYDEHVLDYDTGVGEVIIEDRWIGVVKEKRLHEKVEINHVEYEWDDTNFYEK